MRRRIVISVVLFSLWAGSAFAWGKSGHQIIAQFAQSQLNGPTGAAVHALLGSQTLADIAPLPDVWREQETPSSHPKTALWHFVDIPTDKAAYDETRDCPAVVNNEVPRNCVVSALAQFQTVLRNPTAPQTDRVRALTFLVHFVGDVHQPLHSTSRFNHGISDRGANGVHATFLGHPDPNQKENLHHVWDDDFIDNEHRTQADYVQHLRNDVMPHLPAAAVQQTTVIEWANSAHALAVSNAYNYPGTSLTFAPIGQPYVNTNTPVVDQQLALAGLHLARFLEATLGGTTPPGAPALPAVLPQPDHIVIVVEENKSYADVIGSANAPYINGTLRALGTVLTKSYGLHHPSQPNYLELFSGSAQGVCTDTCPAQGSIAAPNLAKSLRDAGKSFTGYAENLPAPIVCGPTSQQYAGKHAPWIDFAALPPAVTQDFSRFPTTPAGFAALPAVAYVIPNLINDMHSVAPGSGHLARAQEIAREVRQGDDWLKQHLDAYVQWARNNNSILIVTWDEDSADHPNVTSCQNAIATTPPANRIPTIVVGAHVKAHIMDATTVTHRDILRTVLDLERLAPIGGPAHAITTIWQ